MGRPTAFGDITIKRPEPSPAPSEGGTQEPLSEAIEKMYIGVEEVETDEGSAYKVTFYKDCDDEDETQEE